MQYPYFILQNFVNDYTVNIFCDASMHNTDGCYGAIVFRNGQVLESIYRVCKDTTNNNAEIKAIRLSVYLALKYKLAGIPVINIFSDSQISVYGIRDRIYRYRVWGDQLMTANNTPVANQSIFIEIVRLFVDYNLTNVYIYHQKGHVKINNIESLLNAKRVFKNSNGVKEDVSLGFIEYISMGNDMVDVRTGKELYKFKGDKCVDPIYFTTQGFREYARQYKQQIESKGERRK